VTGVPSRRLWFVRHGETTGQSSLRFHGSNDVPLSDLGRAQVLALRPLLDGVAFSAIVHSPLVRAAESARLLAAGIDGPPRLVADERWREISFGACEGMTEAEIAAAFPGFWAAYRAGRHDGFPGGELRSAFAARVRSAALELAAGTWGGDLLVVAHRGSIRQALRALLDVPAGERDPFGVELASVTTVVDEGRWRLEALGLLP
jgi:probable phosphoglycerate mutase